MTLPSVNQRLVSGELPDKVWYTWFRAIEQKAESGQLSGSEATAAIAAIATALGSPDGTVGNIPPQADPLALQAGDGIQITGLDIKIVGLSPIEDTGVGDALVKITRDAYGRVEGTAAATTDNLPEGTTNLYFTDERAQDAVGTILADTADIDFTYDDATPAISGVLTAAIHSSLSLADSAVQSVVAGTNVTVDNTDPQNPIVSAAGGGGGSGTVTSVSVAGGTGLDSTGSPITTSGTITLDLDSASIASLALADSSVQPGDNVSTLTNDAGYLVDAPSDGSTYGRKDGAWAAAAEGTVTSVKLTVPTGLTVSGSPVTTSGTLAVTYEAGYLGYTTAEFVKLSGIEPGAQVNVATNLAQGTRTTTTVPVTSSTGTAATLSAATTSLAGVMSSADKTKLDGVATGATANSADASLRDRATHTGTQLASTISDFAATVRATVLTGLSLASSAAVVATDTILAAIGKLQAQINLRATSSTGTYTPTLTNTTNITSATATTTRWFRIGNMVHVSGRVTITPTSAATASELQISLPVASNFTNTDQCTGTGASEGVSGQSVGQFLSDATSDQARLLFLANSTGGRFWSFAFDYEVL